MSVLTFGCLQLVVVDVRRVYASTRPLGGTTKMPLVSGKQAATREGFSENTRREMQAGKPQKQAVAIAYSQARKAKPKKNEIAGLGLISEFIEHQNKTL